MTNGAETLTKGESIKLRWLKVESDAGGQKEPLTVFLALSDSDFSGVQANGYNEQMHGGYVVHTINGHNPSSEDFRAAENAFNQSYGTKAAVRTR